MNIATHRHGDAESVSKRPTLPALDGEYWTLDLSDVYNRSTSLLEDPHEVELGDRVLHGLPFRFANQKADRTLLVLERDGPQRTAIVLVNAYARWLVFAHAVLETDLYDGSPVGMPCAEYVIHYADESVRRHVLRLRFEIGPSPRKWSGRAIPLDWGQTPFLALNDAKHELMDRCCGRYDAAGARFVDIDDPQSRIPYVLPYRFYLWPLVNPVPDKKISHLELNSAGRSIVIGAITASGLGEEPFGRGVSRDLLVTLDHRALDERVAVQVDRGFNSYTYRLAGGTLEPDINFPKGWGAPLDSEACRGYAKVAAQPSATLRVVAGSEVLGECRWQSVLERGEARINESVSVRLVNSDRTWVRTRIVDAKTGQPLTCRVHFRTLDGLPVAPYSHHAHINSDGSTWNLDIGGDVRLGSQTYAYVDGGCEGWLPVGRLIVEIARGFEYRPLHRVIDIDQGQSELCLQLERFSDLRTTGYYSGDTHVHFVSTQGAELEARGEGISVVNLLLSQWGHLYTNTEDFTGRAHVSHDGDTIVFACQENRTNMLGHISLLGLRTPIMPWCTGGAEEADLGGGLETTLSHWADECHAQGGTVVLAHFPVPNGECAALIATGRLDAVEMIAYDDYNIREYYRYLNCGYRLPMVAGSDKMTSEVPIGLMRTYSRAGARFDYEAWCDGVKRGDTFISSGPLLSLTVGGESPGAQLLRQRGRCIPVRAEAHSVFPINRIEIVANGKVVANRASSQPTEHLALELDLNLSVDTWIVARCYGSGEHVSRHYDVWRRPVMAHTSPVYMGLDDLYVLFDLEVAGSMLQLIEGARLYILERARLLWPGKTAHRHGRDEHVGFLVAPLDDALLAVRRRISIHGQGPRAGGGSES